ncbi:MAG TPA: type II toxin-antitoxin system RelE/ParE family toxin [Terriglobia bacterium]|nr:type II toxin-antitoxin system RelE/ParE family toxin [Terriglobia bacterium]
MMLPRRQATKLFPSRKRLRRSSATGRELRRHNSATGPERARCAPTDSYTRVRDAIYALAENPRPPGCLKLSGREGWRIRVSSYRVIYEIGDAQQTVTVLHIGHRRDVYR